MIDRTSVYDDRTIRLNNNSMSRLHELNVDWQVNVKWNEKNWWREMRHIKQRADGERERDESKNPKAKNIINEKWETINVRLSSDMHVHCTFLLVLLEIISNFNQQKRNSMSNANTRHRKKLLHDYDCGHCCCCWSCCCCCGIFARARIKCNASISI